MQAASSPGASVLEHFGPPHPSPSRNKPLLGICTATGAGFLRSLQSPWFDRFSYIITEGAEPTAEAAVGQGGDMRFLQRDQQACSMGFHRLLQFLHGSTYRYPEAGCPANQPGLAHLR
jgi:hypothetical protein